MVIISWHVNREQQNFQNTKKKSNSEHWIFKEQTLIIIYVAITIYMYLLTFVCLPKFLLSMYYSSMEFFGFN
jgi:hypothetical protein